MDKGYFITGTDTDVGKTWVSIALMRYFIRQGHSVVGMKPVASGCSLVSGKLQNQDASWIRQQASVPLDYEIVNPYAYELPVSPHIAGSGNPVDCGRLMENLALLQAKAQIVIVEGAGGWYTPINDREYIADLAKAFAMPVILVVAIRLGCINHALLSYQAIKQMGIACAGWVAVCIDPDVLNQEEIVQKLVLSMEVPLLARFPYMCTPDFDLLSTEFSL